MSFCVANLPEWPVEFILVCAPRNSNPHPGGFAAFTFLTACFASELRPSMPVEQSGAAYRRAAVQSQLLLFACGKRRKLASYACQRPLFPAALH
jgi:hypothetical protein